MRSFGNVLTCTGVGCESRLGLGGCTEGGGANEHRSIEIGTSAPLSSIMTMVSIARRTLKGPVDFGNNFDFAMCCSFSFAVFGSVGGRSINTKSPSLNVFTFRTFSSAYLLYDSCAIRDRSSVLLNRVESHLRSANRRPRELEGPTMSDWLAVEEISAIVLGG